MPDLSDDAKRERRREYDERYRARHPERVSQSNREYRERMLASDPDFAARERGKSLRWDAAHRDVRAAAARARYGANREAIKAQRRDQRAADPELFRERDRRSYQRNAEAQRAQTRAYRAANPEAVRAAYRRWEQANREIRQAINNRRRQRLAAVPMDKIDRMLSALYRKAIKHDPCFYCGKTAGKFHTDHYVPIVLGGTDHWHNLVRACAKCNLRKNAKHGDDFLRATLQAAIAAAVTTTDEES